MAITVTIEITLAKYTLNVLGQNGGIKATIDGVVCHVPIDTANTDYQNILAWAVVDGNTIAEAD